MSETQENQDKTANERRRANGFGGRTRGSYSENGRKYQGKKTLDGIRFRDLARAQVTKAIPLWIEIMENEDEPSMARLRASELLANYAVGKPRQEVEIHQTLTYESLSLEELQAIADGRLPRLNVNGSAGRTFEGVVVEVASDAVVVTEPDTTVTEPSPAFELASDPVYPFWHPTDE